ncbi:TPA: GNAT family N-acetyltransferase, partial [Escherichia coli]
MSNTTIEIFSGEKDYDLNGFDCGEESLNAFLVNHLKRQHEGKILRAYVLCTQEERPKVLGYYTLSGSCFEKESLPSRSKQKKVPYRNVPSVTLGRLALDKSLQGQGFGSMLVTHAMRVVYNASLAVGIHGLFVEALNDKAKAFYKSLGFIQLIGNNERSLF